MKHITMKEMSMMKKMGWKIKAYYIRDNGVSFWKYFSGSQEMDDYNRRLDGVRTDGYIIL